MPKKKLKNNDEAEDKKSFAGDSTDEESIGEDGAIDPSIIEDTFAEEFSEYNDVDNF